MVNNVLAGVRDVLLILVLTGVLVLGVLFVDAFGDVASQWQQPVPAGTLPVDECGGGIC